MKKISFFSVLRLAGIILFVVILSRIDLTGTIETLKDIKLDLLCLGVGFQLLVLIVKAVRWHLMNDGRSEWKWWRRTFGRFFESYAIGVITPGRLGDLMKAGHEKGKDDKVNTLIRTLSERGFDVGFFILIAALALLSGNFIQLQSWVAWIVFLGGIFILVIAFLLMSSKPFLDFISRLLKMLSGKLGGILINPNQYRTTQTTMILLLSLASNMFYFISCYFLAQSVSMDVDFLLISGGVALAGLINMLPVTIMGLGTRELTFLSVFSSIAKETVMAFSATMLLVAQIGGGIIAMLLGQLFLAIDKRIH